MFENLHQIPDDFGHCLLQILVRRVQNKIHQQRGLLRRDLATCLNGLGVSAKGRHQLSLDDLRIGQDLGRIQENVTDCHMLCDDLIVVLKNQIDLTYIFGAQNHPQDLRRVSDYFFVT